MRIGTLVTTIRLRHPTFLAAQVVTLDHVSGGRAAVGIGTGELEQNLAVGNPPWPAAETMARLEEQAAVLDRLLRGEGIDHAGPAYPTTVPAMPAPITRPRPPLVVAAHGGAGLRVAARHADTWNCLGGQPYGGGPRPTGRHGGLSLEEAVAETRRLLERLDAACVEVGRDPATLGRSVLAYRPATDPFDSLAAYDDFVGAYADLGLEELTFYWPTLDAAFGEPPSAAEEARFERIAAERIGSRGGATTAAPGS